MSASLVAAYLFTGFTALLCAVQIAVVAGAPLGPYVWGGRHEGRFPLKLRISSAFSLLIYAVLVLVILDRAGAVHVLPAGISAPGAWVTFGFLVLGTIMNSISSSRKERMIMTPLAAFLAGSALVVALGF
ncbi:MAG: hypothetical protein QM705_15570 [Ancrocorticia sp.]